MPRRARKDMPRVQRFIHEYVWGKHAGHVTKCAVAAGFGQGKIVELHQQSAANYGYQLLRRPDIKAAVAKENAEKRTLLRDKSVRIIEDTYRQATVDVADLFDENGNLLDVQAIPEDARRAIASIEVERRTEGRGDDAEVYYIHKIKLHDKRASQELFLKWAQELNDKVEHSGAVGIYVVDPYAEPTKASAK